MSEDEEQAEDMMLRDTGRAKARMVLVLAGAVMALALTGCDRPQGDAGPAPAPTASSSAASPPPQASIMRPEIEVTPTTPAPLEPLDVTIGFPEGGSALSDAAVGELEQLVASPQVKEKGPIALGAHSDSAGSDAANMRAAKARGEAVQQWLEDHEIAPERLTLTVFGEQNPVAPNALPDGTPNEEGRARNRRVEIHVPVAGADPEATRAPTLVEEIEDRAPASPASR